MPPTLKMNTALALSMLALAACAPVETKTSLTTPLVGKVRSAGPGDTVMAFHSRRALPNAFGRADLFGRTTNAGTTSVRYLGSQGGSAVFERNGVVVESDATTMSETPLIIPQTTTSHVQGSVGGMPVHGTATSTSYQVIGPRGSTQYATTQRPVRITLGSGQSVTIEGKTLRIVRVGAASVDYIVE